MPIRVQVLDSGATPLTGTATNTTLSPIPGIDSTFQKARQFNGSTSQISFGTIKGSKLDFYGMPALSFEAVVQIDASNPAQSILFDNGELSVRLIENHLAAYVNSISGLKGLRSESALSSNTIHSISVIYEQGVLGLIENGTVLGSVNTATPKIVKTHFNNEEMIMGKAFSGFIDDVRISNISRADTIAPKLSVIAPDFTVVQYNPKPNFQINLSDAGVGVNATSVQVYLNGVLQSGLTITSASISGQMSSTIVDGENKIEIHVIDLAGNETDWKDVLVGSFPLSSPQPVFVDIVGGWNGCALAAPDSQLWCWGLNQFGELLNGNTADTPVPTKLNGLNGIISVSTGDGTICTLMQNHTVKCWGDNSSGSVGIGSSAAVVSTPTIVPGLSGIKQINVGYGGANNGAVCAIDSHNQAWCWGYNANGELGLGDATNRTSPVLIPGLTNVASIASPFNTTCALIKDGTVKCWGDNTYGQLGSGNNTKSLVPVSVLGITNAIELSVGGQHACVRTRDGLIK